MSSLVSAWLLSSLGVTKLWLLTMEILLLWFSWPPSHHCLLTDYHWITDCWIAPDPHKHTDSWFQVVCVSWQYFTVWLLWEPSDLSVLATTGAEALVIQPRYKLPTKHSQQSLLLLHAYLLVWIRVYLAVTKQWLSSSVIMSQYT